MNEKRIDGPGGVLSARRFRFWPWPREGRSETTHLTPSAGGLWRNFSWTLTGNVVSSACLWGQLVVLAKLVRAELVGQFALAFAITGPVMLAANLGLRTVQVTDAERRFRFADYLRLRLLTVVAALLAITAIGLIAGLSSDMMALLWVVGVGKGIDALGDIIHGAFQQAEWMEPIGKALMLNGVVSLAAFSLAVAVSGSVVWGALGSVFGSALTFLAYNLPVYRRWAPPSSPSTERWKPASLWRLAGVAAPLGFAYLLTSLNPNIPTYVIAHVLGDRDLGVYAALAYLTVAGHTVVSAAANVALPRLALVHAEGDLIAVRRIMAMLIAAAVALGGASLILVWAVGGRLVRIIYRPDYAEHESLLRWLIAGMGIAFVTWFLDAGLAAVRVFKVQVPINLVMVATSGAACLVLIPRFGLPGAAWAVCLSLTVQAALKGLVLHRALRSRLC